MRESLKLKPRYKGVVIKLLVHKVRLGGEVNENAINTVSKTDNN